MLAKDFPLLRIEAYHGLLLLLLVGVLVPFGIVEAGSLLLGGLFMGANFFLLGYGIRMVLSSFAQAERVRTGIALLTLKLFLFLGLILLVFSKRELDVPSFAVGVTCLLAAILVEGLFPSDSRRIP